MASTTQNTNLNNFAHFLSAHPKAGAREQLYQYNRHRIYALAFWMTDNEMVAEELMTSVFRTAFADEVSTAEGLDRILVTELRKLAQIGPLTLHCAPALRVERVRRNTRRVDLERAVVQLPPTEKLVFLMHDVEGYKHDRIGRTLNFTCEESRYALHQARLRIRELLSEMVP